MSTRYEIGKQVKQSRKAKRLTQLQLAKITRINKTTISEIENGRFTGSFDIFERLLDSVGLQFSVTPKTHSLPDWDDIEDLFKEDD
ncbi:helix-turn-helix transcriptional regulator [Vibrio parahaemolyticus]|uniref:helix-turn-helix transcriptional regulator n=1 Tax=Vibrio TaxID=662 RepID=UPI0002E5C06F|nr:MULTISPECIES: helix-turn-helix transcriptional regulator [Vibrio]ELV8771624.1 helix-turn-helix transcriptional regulator [Vibrio harveyi]EGQ9713985.1 helix-turn-helix transcriptional regulator [Vibrio alginolyticus]EIV8498702.1 helix-turn-helix transcriptional regulator [Vibrio parahaemolyticus]EJG1746715.1 helix-turn-helix transcriptional regulator [Vibrio parahaemolyticus]KLI70769.1 DNA-binding protein [Vibrio alginolyticus]